jgi:hypothetical protein
MVKNVLKYLRRTKGMFLVYGGEEELVVTGYTNASFQTDQDDSKSQSGYVFTINRGAVSWKSSKQETVADSTTEAEYIAASEAAKEGVWIRKLLSELGVFSSVSSPLDLYCDNNGAIAQAKEPRNNCRMDLPGPTTSVGTWTDYSVGPWDYPACATRHLKAWSTRTAEEKYSVRKLYMSCTVWKAPRRTRLVLSPYSDL